MSEEKKEEIISTKRSVMIEVTATDKHKHEKAGKKFLIHPKPAEKLLKMGWIEKVVKKDKTDK